jgi:hypothetical protein
MINKFIVVVLSFLLLVSVTVQIGSTSFQGSFEALPIYVDAPLPYSYLIDSNSTHYFMFNGTTKKLDNNPSTNRTYLETLAVGNLTANGGTVFLRDVQWNASITRPSNVQIFEFYQGNYTVWGDNFGWVEGANKTALFDKFDCPVATSGTFTLANSVAEQTLLEFNVATTNITEVNQFSVDLDALTKNCTIKVYFKIDGTNYRECPAMRLTNLGSADQLACDMKVTITSIELEGATRAIPYLYILTVW